MARRERIVEGKCKILRAVLKKTSKRGLIARAERHEKECVRIRAKLKEARAIAKKWEQLSCKNAGEIKELNKTILLRAKMAWLEGLHGTAKTKTGQTQKGRGYSYPWQLKLLAIEMMGHETANLRVVPLIKSFFQSVGIDKKQLSDTRTIGHWRDGMACMVRVQVGLELTRWLTQTRHLVAMGQARTTRRSCCLSLTPLYAASRGFHGRKDQRQERARRPTAVGVGPLPQILQ